MSELLRASMRAEIYRDMAKSHSKTASVLTDQLYEKMEERDVTDSITVRDRLTKEISELQAQIDAAHGHVTRLREQASEEVDTALDEEAMRMGSETTAVGLAAE